MILFKIKNILMIISVLSMLSACSPGHLQIDATEATSDSNCQTPKSWSMTDFPLMIYIPQELVEYKPALDNAAVTYKNAFNKDIFNFVLNDPSKINTQWSKSLDSLYDNYFGIFKMISWNFDNVDSGVLAFTGTLTRGCSRVVHADILFNFKNYKFGDVISTPTDSSLVDYESVLIHELGHFIGLGHIDVNSDPISIMNPTIKRSQTKRSFSPNDLSRIKTLYNL